MREEAKENAQADAKVANPEQREKQVKKFRTLIKLIQDLKLKHPLSQQVKALYAFLYDKEAIKAVKKI